jgi:D-cysteine desulfhydrase family pyridoxal phosphate-dependent enzyme
MPPAAAGGDAMAAIKSKLRKFPRQERSLLPTPVHEVEGLSKRHGVGVYIKRDDLTGFGFGGNKTRKLDFLIADALESGCDTLIAVGANQSNFCRMAAAYGAANGFEVHLVLGGAKPETPTGNLRLDHILGASCHHVDDPDWEAWDEGAKRFEEILTGKGRKVYRMPVGGSTPVGALGYVAAFDEILRDEKKLKLTFDAIVHASSSAGTQAGLVVGKTLSGWKGTITGMSVAKPGADQMKDVIELAERTAGLLGTAVDVRSVVVDAAYLGEGYAVRTEACAKAIELFAREEGIFLDNVYTGKAAAGLLDYLEQGRFKKRRNVLFIHTGGCPELFE